MHDEAGSSEKSGLPAAAIPVIRMGAMLKGGNHRGDGDGHWEHHTAAIASNVAVMRAGVVSFAAQHGASLRAQTDIALAVSEAVTNSVVHAFIHQPAGTISLIADAAVDALYVRISDDGSGMSPRTDSPGMGLGLHLIERLTSSFELGAGPRGRGIEMRLSFDAPGMRAMASDGACG
jgi:serine/threonine-protein kinase RsbW